MFYVSVPGTVWPLFVCLFEMILKFTTTTQLSHKDPQRLICVAGWACVDRHPFFWAGSDLNGKQ